MNKILWNELKDGQKIRALDNIRLYDTNSILVDEENRIYLTDDQIKNSSELMANIGDIGIWSNEYQYLEFIHVDSNGDNYSQFLDFGATDNCPEINEKIFEIIN